MRPALFAAVLVMLSPLAAAAAGKDQPARRYYFEGRLLTADDLQSEQMYHIKDPELRRLAQEAAEASRELAQDLASPDKSTAEESERFSALESAPRPGGAGAAAAAVGANIFEGNYGAPLAAVRRRSSALVRRLGPRNRCVVACRRTENRCKQGCADAQSRTGHRLICGCKATLNRCLLRRLALDICG